VTESGAQLLERRGACGGSGDRVDVTGGSTGGVARCGETREQSECDDGEQNGSHCRPLDDVRHLAGDG